MILYHIIFHDIKLYMILYFIIFHYIIFHHITIYYIMLYSIILYYIKWHYIFYYTILYYIILYFYFILQSKHCIRIPCIRKWGAGFVEWKIRNWGTLEFLRLRNLDVCEGAPLRPCSIFLTMKWLMKGAAQRQPRSYIFKSDCLWNAKKLRDPRPNNCAYTLTYMGPFR